MQDQRLEMTAFTGNSEALNKLLQENPFILSDNAMINSPSENILSTAIKSNNLQMALQLAETCPHMLTAIDKDGIRPLDVASAYGFIDIVRQLLVLFPNPAEICRLPGRDGKTAIHHASINGRIDVIDELMAKCPECIRDVTSFGETALHLAIRYFQLEAAKRLVWWLESNASLVELINWKDKGGNSILHYTVARKQLETVELLLDRTNATRIGNALQINALNANNLTPMDLLNIFIESSSDSHMKEILRQAGGRGSHEEERSIQESPLHHHHHETNINQERLGNDLQYPKPRTFNEMCEYFRFRWAPASVPEARNTLLVVAVLFVTVSFQGVINLPPHIFPDNNQGNNTETTGDRGLKSLYLTFNTLILSGPIAIIGYVTSGVPFQRELFCSSFFLIAAYGTTVSSLGLHEPANSLIQSIPLAMFLLRWIPEKIRACCS